MTPHQYSPNPLRSCDFPALALGNRGTVPHACLQVRNVTRDGGFGPWSPWQPCEHLDGDNSGSCLCRARSCDSPRPRCGGLDCLGPAIHIANCSRYVRTGLTWYLPWTRMGRTRERGPPHSGVCTKGQKPLQGCARDWIGG